MPPPIDFDIKDGTRPVVWPDAKSLQGEPRNIRTTSRDPTARRLCRVDHSALPQMRGLLGLIRKWRRANGAGSPRMSIARLVKQPLRPFVGVLVMTAPLLTLQALQPAQVYNLDCSRRDPPNEAQAFQFRERAFRG